MVLVAPTLLLLLDRGDDVHEACLAPITFLYAMERRFCSSLSTAAETFSMNSTISSYRWACLASFAMYMFSSRAEGATAIVFDWWSDMFMWVLDCKIGGLIGGFLIYSLVTVFILNFWVCLFSCGFDDFSEFMGLICWRFQWRIGILYVF